MLCFLFLLRTKDSLDGIIILSGSDVMSDWNSAQYLKFENQRTRPSADLISRISDLEPKTVADLGCGPGNSTALLAKSFKDARIIGLDSSDDMLAKAKSSYPELEFSKCLLPDGLGKFEQSFDLIFSNACIHWIKEQRTLLDAVYEKLSAGGVFAVQLPLTERADFYRLLGSLTADGKWKKLSQVRNFHALSPEEYYDELSARFESLDIWETVYYHTVESAAGVLEWYKGSGLRPYLDLLSKTEREDFLCDLLSLTDENFKVRQNGKIILKMPRLFFTATK